ncbi:hypothetical protein DB31_4831 [Hyalangium minutum]|uniref:Uncharacterized protein n=1 Tax=Hyalangium minutum TaxID=394096 RepID=A0A085VYY6_9BACT|nr:hypothetical protein DB31_4831 [Hyalangium minutum]
MRDTSQHKRVGVWGMGVLRQEVPKEAVRPTVLGSPGFVSGAPEIDQISF